MNNKQWTVSLEQDPETGDLMLPLNDEMLAELNWVTGDTLNWVDNQDGSWSLIKKPTKR